MKRLEGKTAVVTGGGTGIGFATAQRFVDEGAFVYVTGRRQAPLDRAVEALGGNARAVQGSVSDLADLARLFDQVKAERGTLDVLFANAGHGDLVPLGEITEEQYQRTFDINVKGVLFTVQAALPLMRAGGSIILTGSTTGSMGTPAFSVYSATKAAVRNFARSWAQDLRGTGIRVNVLSPGPTLTELAQEVVGRDAMVELGAGTPIGRVGQPDEIAAVAAFLASSDSSFMTGSEVFADGGLAQI
ncbi:SDR family NAD(P)-dependent oxidoreductase [Sphingomonas sp. BK580]|uniref:SDR family NAD(P)-dependent oxidoreductase n=1 Tax=Sphingomonas sp. BK580 TaxID=2586972 RepID=UPI0016163708|nr:SDR family oxidoreductase [Sphingomonas sp. BK580]MBB3693688.1 NAD(P)-dependent dehydrogenase (short-subunit alcohol dehydrogenase family) [Sphingomonas sp. BK580]